jgi:hypothetical protein
MAPCPFNWPVEREKAYEFSRALYVCRISGPRVDVCHELVNFARSALRRIH